MLRVDYSSFLVSVDVTTLQSSCLEWNGIYEDEDEDAGEAEDAEESYHFL